MINTVLITTSGIGERLGNLTKYTNKSLVRVGDKYGICFIIEAYDKNTEFIITLGYFGHYVKDFLLLAYPKTSFTFVDIDLYVGKGSSLGYSMIKAISYLQKPFIFHCCDSIVTTKITIPEISSKNMLFVYPYPSSENYTNIKGNNGIINEINFKKHTSYDYIYTGIVYIYDYLLFWKHLKNCYSFDNDNSSLNDINSLSLMMKSVVLNYTVLDNWYDTGNKESYGELNKIIKPKYHVIEKYFESLCFFENKVIKFINDKEINIRRIIRGEYLYPLTPKIIGYSENFISMELITGTVLSGCYENGFIKNLLSWANKSLWSEQKICKDFENNCKRFYIKKTLDRLNNLNLENERNIINGMSCKNLIEYFKELPENLFVNDTFVKFHGDFILENIIKTEDTFRLIDWRHEFDDQLYYGDIYYELAKLRHNLIFHHANIADNLFTIEYINNTVIVDLKCNYFLIQQLDDFETFISEHNYDLAKIKLITSLIWLNMSPLYEGKLSEFLFYFGKYNLFRLTYTQ